jgi:hypothetical protein
MTLSQLVNRGYPRCVYSITACARRILFMEEKLVPSRFCPYDLFRERKTVLLAKLYSQNIGKFLLLAQFVFVKTKKSYPLLAKLCSHNSCVLCARQTFKDLLWRMWFPSRGIWPLKWQTPRFVLPRVRPMNRYNDGYEIEALWPRFSRRIFGR